MALIARIWNSRDILLMLAFTLAPLALFKVFADYPAARDLSLPHAELRCLKGSCFLLPQESKILIKLPNLVSTQAYFQDRVITLGEESELEIIFPDKSKLIQRNTSLLQIQKGRGSLLRELERASGVSTPESDAKKEQAPQSIIYVGNLPLEVLYPVIDSSIIPENYPANLTITVRIANKLTSDDKSEFDFAVWSIYEIQKDGPPRYVSDFNFTETQLPLHYTSALSVPMPGHYLFTPKGLDPNLSYNGFKLVFSERKDLDSKIQDLLDNYDSNADKPLELRQD